MDVGRPLPPLCLGLFITGDEGERYKGPQEMLLQTNQYVLLCDVMGHAARPFEPFPGPRRRAQLGGPCLGLAGVGGCSSAQPGSAQGGWAKSGLFCHQPASCEQGIPGLLAEHTRVHTAASPGALRTTHPHAADPV